MPRAASAATTRRVKVWKVMGADLLVREGQSLRSPEVPGRLAVGSMIKQVALAGGRVSYQLWSGSGPQTGWVSMEVKGRETLADAGWITEDIPPPDAENAQADSRADAHAAAQELLALGPEATQDDVSSAFRKASVRVHPDRCPDDPDAADKFRQLTEARDLLLGHLPEERAEPRAQPAACQGPLPAAQVSGQIWRSIDSHDPEGLVVREGRSLSSRELAERLALGAMVEELQRDGDRVHYRKLTGDGPETGWISIRSKGKELLRPPGLTLDPERAFAYRMKGHDAKFAVLSLDQALRLLDDTLAAFSRKEFQANLWQKWEECGYDPDKFGAVRFPFVLGVQGPIVAKYGFENSPKGIIDSIVAYWAGEAALNAYPEVAFKNDMMHYLTDPAKQMLAPLGEEDFAAEFCKHLTNVRMVGRYDLVYPGSKPWDARQFLADRGTLAAGASGGGAAPEGGVSAPSEPDVPQADGLALEGEGTSQHELDALDADSPSGQ